MFGKFATTGIGSMPHGDAATACGVILANVDIPFWPQLPGRSFRELMIPQYSEGMPGLRIDPEKQKIWIDTARQDEINAFYEEWTDEKTFGISDEYAKGFSAFLALVQGKGFGVLKGHVTGPLTFTLGLQDEQGVPVYFNEELRELSLMVLKGKVRWQVGELKKASDRVLLFIDEPILSAIGTSAYMGVAGEEVTRLLSEIVAEIRKFGGIPAIHCCGKADWGMVLATGIAVVNYDAFDYEENFLIYAEAVREFLDRGGVIAAGIVPTGTNIRETSVESLKERLLGQIDALSERTGFGALADRLLLTPSCGTGSLGQPEAETVFKTLAALKRALS